VAADHTWTGIASAAHTWAPLGLGISAVLRQPAGDGARCAAGTARDGCHGNRELRPTCEAVGDPLDAARFTYLLGSARWPTQGYLRRDVDSADWLVTIGRTTRRRVDGIRFSWTIEAQGVAA
jgi:hypothetical protein